MVNSDRIVEQLDKLVDTGRVTRDEAERLRADQGSPRFEETLTEIRVRHAGERLDAAVREGEMTREEADEHPNRLQAGEHPKGLRARLARHRRRGHS